MQDNQISIQTIQRFFPAIKFTSVYTGYTDCILNCSNIRMWSSGINSNFSRIIYNIHPGFYPVVFISTFHPIVFQFDTIPEYSFFRSFYFEGDFLKKIILSNS